MKYMAKHQSGHGAALPKKLLVGWESLGQSVLGLELVLVRMGGVGVVSRHIAYARGSRR
jgi:hypothetical protein